MTVQSEKQTLQRQLSFFGLVALGVGGIWGSSWLLVSSTWFEVGGGVVNTLLAWVLVFLLELPLVLAYKRAVPLFPRAEGEMSYAAAAYGRFAGFMAGWFGILVNLIVCAYEVVSLVRMIEFLWPSVTQVYWYKVAGSPVGVATILVCLALIGVISLLHYRGVRLSSAFQNLTSTLLMVLVAVGVVVAFSLGSFENFKPYFGRPLWSGVIAVATMLPFSLAGWETIAKGAEEARDQSGRAGRTVPVAWTVGWVAYMLTTLATGLVLPWTEAAETGIPFAAGLNALTGGPYLGVLLIVTATIGVIGVYNALFYGVTRQMYGMARRGLMPAWMTRIHPKYGTPVNTIWFTTGLMLVSAFIGRKGLIPLVDAAAFAYVILWGSTFLSVEALRRRGAVRPAAGEPSGEGAAAPEERVGDFLIRVLGYVSIGFFLVAMLYPKSPGALVWPLEHIILAGLVLVGLVLYSFRADKNALSG